MRLKGDRLQKQRGFTIVELMIATSVLSVILLMTTVVMTGIGRLYYKGINQSRVQGTVRTVGDEIAQKLQLNTRVVQHFAPGSNAALVPDANLAAYCIGSSRYSFVTGVQIGTQKAGAGAEYKHVLWRDIIPTSAACTPLDLKSSSPGGAEGQELISPSSRLTEFSITGLGGATPPIESPYNVRIGVAYGDDDLLTNPTSSSAQCSGSAGGQFCATASLDTRVVQRTRSY